MSATDRPSPAEERASQDAAARAAALFDRVAWEALAGESAELSDNPRGTEHLVYRFLGKYLPAVLKARTPDARERAWLAFWSYMIARRTSRKPFGLSQQGTDALIERFQAELERRGYGHG